MEADEDARVSQVIGLDTDGRRVFVVFWPGLVGGEMTVCTWPTGMGLEMEMEEVWRWW